MASVTPTFELAQGSSTWWTSVPHGWAYAMSGLASMQASSAPLLLDAYVDRTFANDGNDGDDAVDDPTAPPYRRPWLGFVHHTFDTTFSDANCTALFRAPKFLASLPACRCLIVLTQSLAEQVRAALVSTGFGTMVRVRVLTHPTPLPAADQGFMWPNLLANPNPVVVQIGWWMRNQLAICDLPLPASTDKANNPLRLSKAALVGPPGTACSSGFGGCSIDPDVAASTGVTLVQPLDAEAYATLLQRNVVFLNLIDASAVNTVLECIAYNTPLVVNRLPALEEALGTGYPGFYDTQDQAVVMLTKYRALKPYPHSLYIGLSRMDKTRFMLSTFADEFRAILLEAVVPAEQE